MKNWGKTALLVTLFAAAAALIALGVLGGGAHAVFVKAVTICAECMGLG